MALESVALSVKVAHGDIKVRLGGNVDVPRIAHRNFLQDFLSQAIDPPSASALDHAISVLDELGALSPEGDVTPMGQHLVRDPRFPSLANADTILRRRCYPSILG